MDNQILELLNKKLEEQVKSHSEFLSGGGSEDFAAYKMQCGIIRGLQTAQREIGDLVRKLKDDNDD
jgi:hypothetical protein